MNLSPGDRLGPYELVAVTGEGGMGTVWKARDTRLDRTVAVKVSRSAFTERFDREARAVAALNHPHICQLYDVGPDYLVMEFVDGQPLKGPLPREKAVEYSGQILDALDAAHKKGITHRDLKPANILVTPQGIKLLDFGLAKRAPTAGPEDATMTAITTEGQIAGTLQYMSPEQLQGKAVDARSDLFSFGCVLYEMLSGRRAFTGGSAASVIAAIMEHEPEKLELTPPLERVLRTALAKDPNRRFQTAVDLRRALQWAMEEQPPQRAGSRVPVWAIGLPLALGAGLAWSLWRTPAQVTTPPGAMTQLTRDGRSASPALSPDGKLLAFSSAKEGERPDIYVQQTGSAAIRLTDDPATDTSPAFSADGSKIYFTSFREPAGIYEIPSLGGDPRLVIAGVRQPRPSPKGTHLVYLDDAQGWMLDTLPPGKPVALGATFVNYEFIQPVWSPDGSRLIIRKAVPEGDFEIYSLNGARQVLPLVANLAERRLGQPAVMAVMSWLPNDDLLFSNALGDATNLWRIPLREAANGTPSPVTAGTFPGFGGVDAGQRRLVFAAISANRSLFSLPCDLNTGTVLGPPKSLTGSGVHPDITPDGRHLVYCSRKSGPQAIWSMDLQTGKDRLLATMNRLGDDYSHTVISPDGQWIAAMAQEPKRIVLLNAAGGTPRAISSRGARLRGFTPDGRGLLVSPLAGQQVFYLDVATGAQNQIVSRGAEVFHQPRLSADGQWLAFVRLDGRLFIARFRGGQPIPPADWIEVAPGATQPAWSPDGRSLYYRPRSGLGALPGRLLMRQVLHPETRRPVGAPTVFYRFEELVFSDTIVNPIAVARDQIIVVLTERGSDLWSLDLPTP